MIYRPPLPLLAASLLALSAHAEEAPPRRSLWGGRTLVDGNALWANMSAGLDMTGLLALQVGYVRALRRDVDLGASVGAIEGVGRAYGGGVKARYHFARFGSFDLATELPLSLQVYTDGPPPHLYVYGAEPALMMSWTTTARTELYYGAAARGFLTSDTVMAGPEARVGGSYTYKAFSVFATGRASWLYATLTPPQATFSLDAGASVQF